MRRSYCSVVWVISQFNIGNIILQQEQTSTWGGQAGRWDRERSDNCNSSSSAWDVVTTERISCLLSLEHDVRDGRCALQVRTPPSAIGLKMATSAIWLCYLRRALHHYGTKLRALPAYLMSLKNVNKRIHIFLIRGNSMWYQGKQDASLRHQWRCCGRAMCLDRISCLRTRPNPNSFILVHSNSTRTSNQTMHTQFHRRVDLRCRESVELRNFVLVLFQFTFQGAPIEWRKT